MRRTDQVHELDDLGIDVEFVVIEHEAGHTVRFIKLHHLAHDVLGRPHPDAAKERAHPAAAETASEGTAKLRDHRQGAHPVDTVVIAVHIDQMPGGKRQLRELLIGQEMARPGIIAIDQFGRCHLQRLQDCQLPVSHHHHVEHLSQRSIRAGSPAVSPAFLLVLIRRVDQGYMRPAQNDSGLRAHGSDRAIDLCGGRHLRCGRRQAVAGGGAGTRVIPHHLFIIFDPGKIQHLHFNAGLLQYRRHLQNAQGHEDPLIQQKDRRWSDQTDPFDHIILAQTSRKYSARRSQVWYFRR